MAVLLSLLEIAFLWIVNNLRDTTKAARIVWLSSIYIFTDICTGQTLPSIHIDDKTVDFPSQFYINFKKRNLLGGKNKLFAQFLYLRENKRLQLFLTVYLLSYVCWERKESI